MAWNQRDRKIVLHIGMSKTGSTAIQMAMANYDRGGTRYAQLGDPNHSIALNAIFAIDVGQEAQRSMHFLGQTAQEREMDRVRFGAMLESELALERERLIISGEVLSTFDRTGVQALWERLSDVSDSLEIIGYARDPMSFASAIVQQCVKGRGAQLQTSVRYRENFGAFQDIFGRDAFHLKAYDLRRFPQSSVVADFSEQLSLEHVDLGIHENPAGSLASIKLLNLLRVRLPLLAGHPELAKGWTRLYPWLQSTIPGPKFRLPDDIAASFCSRAEVDWLFDNFGIDFRDPPYPETPIPGDVLEGRIETFLLEGVNDLRDGLRAAMADTGITFNLTDDTSTLMARAFNHFLFLDPVIEYEDASVIRDVAVRLRNGASPEPDLVSAVSALARRLLPYETALQDDASDGAPVADQPAATQDWSHIFWQLPWSFRPLFDKLDPGRMVVFFAGDGTHATRAAGLAGEVIAIATTAEVLTKALPKLAPIENLSCRVANESFLPGCDEATVDSLFSYDCLVQMPERMVDDFLAETAHALRDKGRALLHHSNFLFDDAVEIQGRPHGRASMSAARFAEMANRHGFEIVVQQVIPWGTVTGLDCLSLIERRPRRPAP